MTLIQNDQTAACLKGEHSREAKNGKTTGAQKATVTESRTLTFVTSDGESIVFDGMDVPVEEAAALMSEEALGKTWNRQVEAAAWRDM